MIEGIIKGLFTFVINLINLLIVPLDLIIASALPSLSNILNYISEFFNYISNFIPWVVSYLGLPTEVLNIIVAYFVFKITVPITVASIKIAIKWYNALKT